MTASSLALAPMSPVLAANYNGFGSTYSEVVDPKNAVLNQDTAGTEDVKVAKEGLYSLIKVVGGIKSELVCTIIQSMSPSPNIIPTFANAT